MSKKTTKVKPHSEEAWAVIMHDDGQDYYEGHREAGKHRFVGFVTHKAASRWLRENKTMYGAPLRVAKVRITEIPTRRLGRIKGGKR